MSKLSASIAATIAVTALATIATAQSAAGREGAKESAPVTPAGSSSGPNPGLAPATGGASGAPANANPAPSPPATSASKDTAVSAPTTAQELSPGIAAESLAGTAQASPQATLDAHASPPIPHSYRFSATVDVANLLWRSGRGYDLFSDRDVAWRFGIGIGYDALRLPASLTLAVETGFLYEPSSDTHISPAFGSLEGSMSAATALVGASLRWAISPLIAPYGRVGMLATRVNMELDSLASGAPGSMGASWSHSKWTEGALLGAGVVANLPPQSPVNFGLLVEGGVWLQRAVDIQLERDLPRDAIPTLGAHAGKLENTGPYIRVAGVLRF